ncbi:MAG: HpcH/HpaI aldolase/citrate lyase family protein [Paracoccaceae bacterium]
MPAHDNPFKAALSSGTPQIGLWMATASPYLAELVAGAGFDWVVVDGEHAPNDLRSITAALAVMAARPSAPVVRLPIGEAWLIKQLLDAGCRNLLIPMVESGAQAADMVAATRYPPHGRRGVGAALARASDFGRDTAYMAHADSGICLLLQIESRAGLAALDDILALEGVDGVFIGPADLAADMGFPGQSGAPAVLAAIDNALLRIRAAGKAAGILATERKRAQHYLDLGANFVAVGVDVNVLVAALADLHSAFKPE